MNNSDILFTRKNAKLLEKVITGNSIYKKKTRHERYHDRVYLFIYERTLWTYYKAIERKKQFKKTKWRKVK